MTANSRQPSPGQRFLCAHTEIRLDFRVVVKAAFATVWGDDGRKTRSTIGSSRIWNARLSRTCLGPRTDVRSEIAI